MDTFPSYITKIFLLCLLCAIMVDLGMSRVSVQCHDKDHRTLLNFRHVVTDPSAILFTWSGERDCCQWAGIQCDNTTGRVIELRIPCSTGPSAYGDKPDQSHCLTGELPLSLLHLEFLNLLDLGNNDFKAIRYDSSRNSTSLQHLDLSHNYDLHIDNLQWLSRFSSLKSINLSSIDLHRQTNWLQLISTLPSLLELHLESCQLKNIYSSLKYVNFTSLEILDLFVNDFDSQFLPNWLFNLSGLSAIELGSTSLEGQLPVAFLNLRNLRYLHMASNKLCGPLPHWFGEFENLQDLDVGDNLFSGPIPPTLGNLSSLLGLMLISNNLIGSLPENLAKLSELQVLGVRGNLLSGVVSERNFIKMSNLKYLYIGSPGLILDFDSLWNAPFQLEFISLDYMGHMLPAWLYTQTSLKFLRIRYSSFESQDRFWNFATQLVYLNLEDNSIDTDMSNVLLNATFTNLPSNNLKGGLPRLSPNVQVFGIRNNSLSGPISSFLCQKMNGRSQLLYLDMSNNLLYGGLTDCWMNWKSLLHVKLGGNNLTGKIPPSIGFLSNLTTLHLIKNRLFGEIPTSLKKCQNLQILNLGENIFSGNIPNWIGHNVKALQLRSNQFSGNIHPQICQLSSLIILDLADNKLSGAIPHCLYNLTAMFSSTTSIDRLSYVYKIATFTLPFNEILMLLIKGNKLEYGSNLKLMRAIDFSSNNLSGSIPPKIVSLTELVSLNLSHNQLMGNIPKEIGNLKKLESLDLSSNQLSGEIPQSIAELSFLGTLNISFNNLNGKIPIGTQLQGFDALCYIGNPELCGAPLPYNCTHGHDFKPNGEDHHNNDSEFLSSFYLGMGVGFATTFSGVCVLFFFNKTCRYFLFKFLEHVVLKKIYRY